MKVLFDQNIPKGLRLHLPGHSISVANEVGWAELANGELLKEAESEGYEVLITADQSIFYQQNNLKRKIALVVLNTNHWGRISKQVELVALAVDKSPSSGFQLIEFEPLKKKAYPRSTAGPDT